MRDMNPDNNQNWDLVCSHCGAVVTDPKETIDLADGHFQQEHPGEDIAFSMVWVGVGPQPKKRTQRRRF